MASAWGASWGSAWGSAWGSIASAFTFVAGPTRVSRPSFTMTQNDTAPPMTQRLLGRDGKTSQVLPAGTVVRFTLRKPDGTLSVNRQQCTIVDGTLGDITYAWQAGQLPVPGPYRGELEVTMPTGEVETFPTSKLRISVTEEYA